MPRKSLERLLEQDFATLTVWERYRVVSAMLRADDTCRPFHILFKRELPLCGARCRDGHPCQARATRDIETGCYVRNGRCRLHGGLSTGPRTVEGKRRIGEAARRRAQARSHDEPAD
jgi:hypothetical protein